MKHLLNEHTILELNCHRVSGRPSIVLENFNQYSRREQAQINEAYNAMFDLMQQELLNEISLSGAKAKIKGKFAGAKAAMQGDQNAGNVGQQAELQSLFDDLKTNIGTIVAQHEKDVSKLGFKPEDEISKALAQIRQTIEASPANIEIKDNSLAGKAGHFAKEKVLPVVMKAVSPVISKVTQMYEKSGPIKGFDDKYQKIVSDIGQKFPALAEPLSKVSEFAKKNKGKATFLIGSLTALLTITGGLTAGGLGVFALGVGLRGVFGMLAGEPPAKAFGKAALTAAVGKLVGGAFNMLFGDIDFNLFGAEEAGAKAGIGEIVASVDGAEVGQAELERIGDNLGHKLQIAIDNADIEVTGDSMTGFNGDSILSSLSEDERILLRAAFMDGDTAMSGKFADEKIEQALMAVASGKSGAEEFGDEITRNLTQKFEKIAEINPEQFKALSDKLDSATEISELQFDDSGNVVGDTGDAADAGGDLQVELEPNAESAFQDLDAKGLTFMHGTAQGNIKDLIAWSDEYTPTGSDFKGRMLADLKATDAEGFRQHLFHTMHEAKEKEMLNYFQQLTAAAREAGHTGNVDPQTMMELDPATYQAMKLAQAQSNELQAAWYDGDNGTIGQQVKTRATMFRNQYNRIFPDDQGIHQRLADEVDGL